MSCTKREGQVSRARASGESQVSYTRAGVRAGYLVLGVSAGYLNLVLGMRAGYLAPGVSRDSGISC